MKARSRVLVPVAALSLLVGCATQHGHGHGGAMMGGPGGPGGMGSMGSMGGGDPDGTCARYRQMMAGRSPAEQQAAMEARMRSMHGGDVTPEQARMQRETMDGPCAVGQRAR